MKDERNIGKSNKLLVFEMAGGYPHPDPRHLGSRLYGVAKIISYGSYSIIMTVKPHQVDYVKDYVAGYMNERSVAITNITEKNATEYEHQTVY